MASIQTSTASVSQLAAPVATRVMITDNTSQRKRHLTQRPSVSVTRKLSHKRSKINFSSQLYSRLVKSALDLLEKKRDSSALDSLTSQILLPGTSPDSLTTESLTTILSVLSQHVSRLDNRAVTPLIRALLKYDFLSHLSDTQFIKSYSTFLTVLVSGIPKWFSDVSKNLVATFIVKSEIELQPIHKTLKYIIQISPASFSTLPLIIRRNFPNKNAPKEELVHYIENILHILTYCNDLRYTVWSLIVENLIKLDVELQNEIDDVDDEDLNAALENGSGDDMDPESNNDDDEGNETNFPELANEQLLPKSPNLSDKEDAGYDADYNEDEEDESELLHEDGDDVEYNMDIEGITDLSSKLDAIMQLIFQSTEKSFTEDGLEEGYGIALFNTLISIFRTYILPTHYTRCVQYLIFHMVQQQSDLTDSFLVMLLDVVFNSNEIASNRIKAMQYVCSFMARAKSLSRGQLLTVMKYLMSWCNEYVTEREKEVGFGKGGMERFSMLYCVLQGLMYIFCFRFRDLKREDNDEEWELRLDKFFNMMIMSKFNPLKFCNETVVLIFARIVQKVDMCYCFSIIEKNKRERLNGIRDATANTESSLNRFERKQEFLDLEAYFPFDPLMLKDSKRIIHKNYIDWQDFDDSEDSE